MTNSSAAASGGMGVGGALAVGLTILFVALKLTSVITWTWWAVLAPILIYVGLGVAAVILFLVGFGIYVLVVFLHERK